MKTVVVIEDHATKQNYRSEPYPMGVKGGLHSPAGRVLSVDETEQDSSDDWNANGKRSPVASEQVHSRMRRVKNTIPQGHQ
jgi:hypothetical protein